jgi:hypothetical protein
MIYYNRLLIIYCYLIAVLLIPYWFLIDSLLIPYWYLIAWYTIQLFNKVHRATKKHKKTTLKWRIKLYLTYRRTKTTFLAWKSGLKQIKKQQKKNTRENHSKPIKTCMVIDLQKKTSNFIIKEDTRGFNKSR